MVKMAGVEISHPHISVQYDWQSILRNTNEKAWVVCSQEGSPNIYSDVTCKKHTQDEKVKTLDVSTNGVHAEILNGNNLKLNYKTTTSHMISPKASFKDIHLKAIRSMNISPGGSLGVSSSEDGALYVWQTEDGKLRRTLDGHVSEVTHCRFFPSGMVVLSGGVDMRLKIWSVEDGSCPVTLVGHKAAITDTAIIDRGRNVISCGRDGVVHLWDCGTASSLCKIEDETKNVINACDLSSHQWQSDTMVDRSEKECGTEGKLLLLAKENGTLKALDVHSRDKVFELKFASALNSCCFINEHRVVAGQQNGSLSVVDIRNPRKAEYVLKHGKSPINCVKTYYKDRVLVGRSDGACSCISLDNPNQDSYKEQNLITQELIGSNHDPIYDIAFSNDHVYTACRDGVVRKYCVDVTST